MEVIIDMKPLKKEYILCRFELIMGIKYSQSNIYNLLLTFVHLPRLQSSRVHFWPFLWDLLFALWRKTLKTNWAYLYGFRFQHKSSQDSTSSPALFIDHFFGFDLKTS